MSDQEGTQDVNMLMFRATSNEQNLHAKYGLAVERSSYESTHFPKVVYTQIFDIHEAYPRCSHNDGTFEGEVHAHVWELQIEEVDQEPMIQQQNT